VGRERERRERTTAPISWFIFVTYFCPTPLLRHEPPPSSSYLRIHVDIDETASIWSKPSRYGQNRVDMVESAAIWLNPCRYFRIRVEVVEATSIWSIRVAQPLLWGIRSLSLVVWSSFVWSSSFLFTKGSACRVWYKSGQRGRRGESFSRRTV